MRAIAGLLAFHCALLAVGFALLRALGLLAPGRRAIIAALGAAHLAGMSLAVVALIVLLVLGVPLTLATAALVGLACLVGAFAVARRRIGRGDDHRSADPASRESPRETIPTRTLARLALCAAGAYVAFGAFALARGPTRGDDARLWSLKGLTLTYYDKLRPEIFQSPLGSTAHTVYPLFQPVLEAVLNRATGRPELRLFHTELWLLVVGAIWTGAYLIWRHCPRPRRGHLGLGALALLAVTPAVLTGVSDAGADVAGSVLLGCGALALGLWIDGDTGGSLGLATVLLAAAANTKDEDMVAVALVVVAAGVVLLVAGDRRRLRPWAGSAAACAAMILPWRIWVAAHHLSDSVTPPLPHALSPIYVLDRVPELHRTVSAMMTETLAQWGWLAAIFLVVCAVSLATSAARRLACFYVLSFAAIVASLLWLYTTTPLSLGYLLPTSMYRTVDVFMALTPFACAHLLSRLAPRST